MTWHRGFLTGWILVAACWAISIQGMQTESTSHGEAIPLVSDLAGSHLAQELDFLTGNSDDPDAHRSSSTTSSGDPDFAGMELSSSIQATEDEEGKRESFVILESQQGELENKLSTATADDEDALSEEVDITTILKELNRGDARTMRARGAVDGNPSGEEVFSSEQFRYLRSPFVTHAEGEDDAGSDYEQDQCRSVGLSAQPKCKGEYSHCAWLRVRKAQCTSMGDQRCVLNSVCTNVKKLHCKGGCKQDEVCIIDLNDGQVNCEDRKCTVHTTCIKKRGYAVTSYAPSRNCASTGATNCVTEVKVLKCEKNRLKIQLILLKVFSGLLWVEDTYGKKCVVHKAAAYGKDSSYGKGGSYRSSSVTIDLPNTKCSSGYGKVNYESTTAKTYVSFHQTKADRDDVWFKVKCHYGKASEPIVMNFVTSVKKEVSGAGSYGGGRTGAVLPEVQNEVTNRSFSTLEISAATLSGEGIVKDLYALERRLMESGNVLARGTPAAYHQSFLKSSKEASDMGHAAMGVIEASRELAKSTGLANAQDAGIIGLRQFSTSAGSQFCPRRRGCQRFSASKFRTIDGMCNNLGQPDWGKTNTGLQRIGSPTYNDSIFEPRTLSVTGQRLPSARQVSAATVLDADKPDREFTALVTQFGQLLDHDLSHISVFQLDPENNIGIQCCRDSQLITPSPHPACFPIDIPANDRFFSRFGRRCMEFVRALPAPRSDCSLGFADQLNTISHYLDGSQIYGSTDAESRNLRAFRNGKLAVQASRSLRRASLPVATTESDGCTNLTLGVRCFRAGDNRVNEQPGLTLMHLVWVREHNRVAAELQTLNPSWSDEQLFQETRRIVIAEWAHVVYNEWLPLILGPTYMTNFNLLPQKYGFSQDYDPSINPSITNEFATAAFRFGHTLLQSVLPILDPRTRRQRIELLRNNFNSIQAISTPRAVEGFLRGFTTQPMQSFDGCVTEDVTTQLFRTTNPFGLDLVALNTQRGRDHGLSTYNDMREICGLGRARSFSDLLEQIPEENVRRFQSVYAHPDDIDLFVGGISETSMPDAVLGPTFLCIIGDQFTKLKRGDRFFYEFNLGPQSFNEAQIKQIRKTSFARILCDNTDVGEMQPLAFIRPFQRFNNRQPCKSPKIPRVNLAPFRGA